jgi:hypothetical protein
MNFADGFMFGIGLFAAAGVILLVALGLLAVFLWWVGEL